VAADPFVALAWSRTADVAAGEVDVFAKLVEGGDIPFSAAGTLEGPFLQAAQPLGGCVPLLLAAWPRRAPVAHGEL